MRRTYAFASLVLGAGLAIGGLASAAHLHSYAYVETELRSLDIYLGASATLVPSYTRARLTASATNDTLQATSAIGSDLTAALDVSQAYLDAAGGTTSPKTENAFSWIGSSTATDYARADGFAAEGSLNVLGTSSGALQLISEVTATEPGLNAATTSMTITVEFEAPANTYIAFDVAYNPYIKVDLSNDVAGGTWARGIYEMQVTLSQRSSTGLNDLEVDKLFSSTLLADEAGESLMFDPTTSGGYDTKAWRSTTTLTKDSNYRLEISFWQRASAELVDVTERGIPLPTTLALAGIGLASLGVAMRRKAQ